MRASKSTLFLSIMLSSLWNIAIVSVVVVVVDNDVDIVGLRDNIALIRNRLLYLPAQLCASSIIQIQTHRISLLFTQFRFCYGNKHVDYNRLDVCMFMCECKSVHTKHQSQV